MKNKKTQYPMIALLLAVIVSAACGTTSPQPSATTAPPTATQTPAGDILGTTTSKVLTTMNFTTGQVMVNGLGIELDSGENIDAQLPSGVIDTIMAGIRVRVEPINHPEFEWVVVEIVAGGVATPDLSAAAATATARCRLRGAVFETGSDDLTGSVDSLAQLLTEKMGCETEIVLFFQPEVLPAMFLAGEADFALVSFQDFLRNRDFIDAAPLLIPTYSEWSAYYRGAFIVRTGFGAQSLEGAEGDVFAYTVSGSYYGYHLPRVALANQGHDPNAFFSETISVGGSSREMFQTLLDGEADIGIIWADEETDARISMEEEMPDIWDTIEIIAYTPWIPDRVIMVLESMPEVQQLNLQNALIEISMDDLGQQVLNGIYSITGFDEPDERLWTAIDMIDLAEQLEDDIGPWP